MAKSSRKSNSTFPWKTMTLIMMLGIGALVHFDVQANKTFEKSHIAAFLRDAGQYERASAIKDKCEYLYENGNAWARKNLPEYQARFTKTVYPVMEQGYEAAKPAINTATQMAKDGYEILLEKLAVAISLAKVYGERAMLYLEEQAPGMKAAIIETFNNAKAGLVTLYGQALQRVNEVDWAQLKNNLALNVKQSTDWVVEQVKQYIK